MAVLANLPRKFKIGATTYDDPIPDGDLDSIHEHFAQTFPQVRHTQLFESDGQVNADSTAIIYNFVLLPVKTNG